ncbi:MAG: hypothetical protein U9M89_00990 [Patescibacteria group bacterium]|nr:hypothetical protein [Patescibacteria group bacterium]
MCGDLQRSIANLGELAIDEDEITVELVPDRIGDRMLVFVDNFTRIFIHSGYRLDYGELRRHFAVNPLSSPTLIGDLFP